MKNLEIEVQFDQLNTTIKKLVSNILNNGDIVEHNQLNLWDLFEQLNIEDFISLKNNVYFADFLRLFSISVMEENSLSNFSPERNIENYSLNLTEAEDSEHTLQKNENKEQSTSDINNTQTLKLSTRLDDLGLPNRFQKLIKRLRNVSSSHQDFTLGETLGDLVSLSTYQISCLPGVGLSYIKTFEELKLLVPEINKELESTDSDISIDIKSVDISNMRLSLGGVDKAFIKALEKYARHIDVVDLNEHIDEVLRFDKQALIKLAGFGEKIIDKLIEFRALVEKELENILLENIDYEALESTLIVPKNLGQLSLLRMEKVLLEDIDNYLDKLSDDDSDIIQKRWGFVEHKQTLEEIGEGFEITRERVRQKEVKIRNNFMRHLRVSQSGLWKIIEPNLTSDIRNNLETLFSCFDTKESFYDFLSFICEQESLIEYVYPNIDNSILNTYFAENGAPIHIEDIKEYLIDLDLIEVRNIDNAVRYLFQQDILSIENEYVWPRQLGKAEASACVLVNHKKGLPWLDISKLVNSNSYSRTPLYEDRLDHEGFNSPDYIFLGGKGIYKHTKFIDTENIILDEIFIEFMEYAELNSRKEFHLNECYQSSTNLRKYDYYEVRHFVKHFGEDYGFYFDGRSQTDSIGLEKGFRRLTQKDVIVEAMVRNEKPLTKPEIANVLKSKSLNHAAFYLDELIDAGKVVQVDRMLYTIPELAYKNINLKEYINAIEGVLYERDKPVEPSVFRDELNSYFSKSYSKYFYSSIARLYAKKEGWFRKYSLYSIKEIPFQSLNAVLENVCISGFSVNENIDILQKHIAIDRKSADRAIRNWQNYSSVSVNS